MDTNDGKELLTTIIIKKELLKLIFYDFLFVTIEWCAIELFFLLITIFFRHADFYLITIIILTAIVVLCFLGDIIKRIYLFYQINKEQFTITKAILYKKEEHKGIKGRGLHNKYVPPKLFFDRCGNYNVSDYRYYVWSHAYCMLPHELFETSRVDDHFTLVVLNNKIIMVYNDKFFDTSSLQYSE